MAVMSWMVDGGRIVALVVVLTWSSAACGSNDGVAAFGDEEIGTEIAVSSGEEFEIRLESNPSTGYGWKVAELFPPTLVVLSSSYHLAADTDLVGAAGIDVFRFTAGRGAGVLRLEYVRSFDDPVVPRRVAEFIVRVDGALPGPTSDP